MTQRMAAWTAAMREERYADAWALSALTLAERNPERRDDPALPYHRRWVWDGRPLDGRDVLVRCYHGLGDTIMFARFLPLLAQRAASVTVEVQPELLPLIATVAGSARLSAFDPAHPLPPAEVDVEIMELAFALRAAPDAAPRPYLHAAPAPLPDGTIGLCHAAGTWDAERTIPGGLVAPLCRQAPCLLLMPQTTDLAVLNPEGCSLDIGETAALVAGCGLVITVDTMVAHLAGALGRPAWVMLKAEPDWRWPRADDRGGGRRSPWYPSLRLYHQPEPGDWNEVVAEIARDLALIAAQRTTRPGRATSAR